MKEAYRIAAGIARKIELSKVVAVDPVTEKLYGYTQFVVDCRVLRRIVDNHWKLKLPLVRSEAYDVMYEIIEERLNSLPV